MKLKLSLLLLIPLFLSGCASWHYSKTEKGQLKGKIIVEWLEPEKFRFVPDSNDPFTFVRSNGEQITPGEMITDGGSIPRPVRVFRHYSPWGYTPAFIIHDWIFRMKYCKLDGYENYDVDKAATIMSEVMKTMMEATVEKDKDAMYFMYEAVKTAPVKKIWREGRCGQSKMMTKSKKTPIYTFEIDAGKLND